MHRVDSLVLSCIDFRFRPRVHQWMQQNLEGQADHVAIAGASKALLDPNSRAVVLDQIRIARELHSIKTIYIAAHKDCGAYGGSSMHQSSDDEVTMHSSRLQEAAEVVRQSFPDVDVRLYLFDFDQVLDLTPAS